MGPASHNICIYSQSNEKYLPFVNHHCLLQSGHLSIQSHHRSFGKHFDSLTTKFDFLSDRRRNNEQKTRDLQQHSFLNRHSTGGTAAAALQVELTQCSHPQDDETTTGCGAGRIRPMLSRWWVCRRGGRPTSPRNYRAISTGSESIRKVSDVRYPPLSLSQAMR